MKRLYEKERLSGPEIADELGCSETTIYTWLERHGIERRGGNHPGLRLTHSAGGYVVWDQTQTEDKESIFFPVHRLVAIAEHGTEAVADCHVHHKNGIPWDNRPDNLEPLTPAEHRDRHKISREDLLNEIRAAATVFGFAPNMTEVATMGEYSRRTYRVEFGAWQNALEAADIDPETGEVLADGWDITPEDLGVNLEFEESDATIQDFLYKSDIQPDEIEQEYETEVLQGGSNTNGDDIAHNLQEREVVLLKVLAEGDGILPAPDAAEQWMDETGLARATATETANKLVERELMVIAPNPADARCNNWSLTDSGHACVRDHADIKEVTA